MTVKKQPCIERASEKHPTNWDAFWRGFFQYGVPAFIAIGTWLSLRQSNSNAQNLQAVDTKVEKMNAAVSKVQETATQVKLQGDGQRTAQLKTLAITAENLAVATKTEKDKKAATEAWEAYDQHVLEQQKIENYNQKSP